MASAFNKILHRRVRAEQSTHGQFHTQAARPGRELATRLQGPVYKYTLLMWRSKEASQVTSTWHEDKSTASLPSATSETRAAPRTTPLALGTADLSSRGLSVSLWKGPDRGVRAAPRLALGRSPKAQVLFEPRKARLQQGKGALPQTRGIAPNARLTLAEQSTIAARKRLRSF